MTSRTALHQVARSGTAAEATALIASGEDPGSPDHNGFTPLHLAAQFGNLAVAEILLRSGAPVDPQNTHSNTPLFTAVFTSQGHGDMINLLRAHGANPTLPNAAGQTPLGLARLIANHNVHQFFTDLD
ncbi:ankyrin repeat domain-containing protein [Actinokineospora terrae]|uniref:Ankyrin repeat-containing protein n=1 Tax=Actinokineospora terrae TaxID=155974 RepID=A0A1H9XBE4_9PSEU|nr:ankyrin repeat domain-containing protein [Actinokineospora terrae]SES42973.1 Ankyrin repeat-containing protein [Actinokineospora terrae]